MTASKKTVRTRRGVEPAGRPARREVGRGRRARTNSSMAALAPSSAKEPKSPRKFDIHTARRRRPRPGSRQFLLISARRPFRPPSRAARVRRSTDAILMIDANQMIGRGPRASFCSRLLSFFLPEAPAAIGRRLDVLLPEEAHGI